MYLQSSRQSLVLFLISIYFQWFLQTFIILKLSEQKLAFLFFILYSLFLFFIPIPYNAASAAASLSSALCGTFAFAPSLKAL